MRRGAEDRKNRALQLRTTTENNERGNGQRGFESRSQLCAELWTVDRAVGTVKCEMRNAKCEMHLSCAVQPRSETKIRQHTVHTHTHTPEEF